MKHSKKRQSPLSMQRNSAIHAPRNSFDMSYHSYFTSPTGMILPNYVQELQPDETLDLSVSNFTRTQPVNTACFSRLQESTDFYFVPYRLLWKYFPEFINNLNDNKSSLYPNSKNPLTDNIPLVSSVPGIKSNQIAALLGYTGKDEYGYPINKGIERMLDLLGMPVSSGSQTTDSMYSVPSDATGEDAKFNRVFNVFRFLAYQYVYSEKFRNTDYTTNDPFSYNIDDSRTSVIENTVFSSDASRLVSIFRPRYVQWRKDRMTALKPSTIGINTQGAGGLINHGVDTAYLQKMLPKNINGLEKLSAEYLYTDAARDDGQKIYGQGIADSVESLRGYMAYDKLMRVKALAGKTYSEQFEAVFGSDSGISSYERSHYLGSFETMLNVGEITATSSGSTGASGSTNVLGQLAGKGISSGNSKNIHYTAKEHGIVIGMHYFTPFSEYDSDRLDDFNRKLTYSDFFNPAYDNLGFQPLDINFASYKGNSPSKTKNYAIGYTSRYSEYKTRVDEVHGEFQSGKSLSAWCIPRSSAIVQTSHAVFKFADFYVNPKVTDTIFALKYDGTQLSDPFLCHFKFQARKISNMSILGVSGF